MLNIPPELIERLQSARHVAVLTGAGISAESGIPTFRDAQTGLWAQYDPADLATPEAFRRNPRLVWEWYAHRRTLVAAAAPNPAHLALAELERRIEDFTLFTQNVDGLHQRAGSRNVLELHGNLTRTRCASESVRIDSWTQTGDVPPHCPRCGAYLRPDVVWFGELLPEAALEQAMQAAMRCELFLSIGTSGIVEPAASLPFLALRNGAYVAEFNLAPSAVRDSFNAHIYGPAGMTLPALIRALDA
jgi:NAD-dependent deacetylase